MTQNKSIYYSCCRLCPRQCGTDRTMQHGFCGEGSEMTIAVATLHNGEEPPLTGTKGSGTIFFTGCTLQCPFCQNHQISCEGMGGPTSSSTFAEICLALEKAGAANINLVTGTHFIPSIAAGVNTARERGLTLPILWNSSGYESREGLSLLDNFIDVYLPDLKTVNRDAAARLFGCPGYPDAAMPALSHMAKSRSLTWQGDLLVRGTIVRHLVMPGELESTRETLTWYARELKEQTLLSVMFQYTPLKNKPGIPDRSVNEREYNEVLELMERLEIDDGFVQALEEDTEWFPDFNRDNPFPSELSRVVWHFKGGFTAR